MMTSTSCTRVLGLVIVLSLLSLPMLAQVGNGVLYDNTQGLELYPPGFSPRTPPASIQVVTTPDGYDNFDVGIDFAEQHMSVNPNNSLQYVFGVNASGGSTWRHTEDAALTWAIANPGASNSGDPWTAYDSLGNVYLQFLSGSNNPVWHSTNNGASWFGGVPSAPGNDRNTMAVDPTSGPYAGYLYAGAWGVPASSCQFARSTNFGATWTSTLTAPNTVPGNMIAVGANVLNGQNVQGGCVYFVATTGSAQATTYNFYRSTDGGATFTQMSNLTVAGYVGTLNTAGRLVINNARTRPYPMIAADNSNGPYRGRFYLVYASNEPVGNGNKPDIFIQYSTDQGATWTPRGQRVNDSANPESSNEWYPAISCDKTTGRLYVKWYDMRDDPTNQRASVYATFSDDGGQTFAPNQRISNTDMPYPGITCAPNTNCYRGDYDAIAANGNVALAVWTDFRNLQYQNMLSYFPDFAMLATPANLFLGLTDSANVQVKVPSVKLYTGVARFTASVSPAAPFTFSFIGGRDSLTSYPDSVTLKIRTTNVIAGTYSVTITGRGPNGTPVHRRTISVDVNTNANTLTVTAPNGGENWITGSTHNVTWVRTGLVDSVKLEYSTNNGTSWSTVTPGVPATPSTYSWNVPNTPTTQARVRVSWSDSAAVNDMSNSVFTISPATFPIITTSPDSLVASLPVGGGTTNGTLTIGNTGTADLVWSLSEEPTSSSKPYTRQPQAEELYPNWRTGKGEADRYHGPEPAQVDTTVGPDSAGYRAIDSDSPGGPIFQWFDISTIGTQVTDWSRGGGSGDDGYTVVPLPWQFPFYGGSYDSLKIVTNGWAGFQNASTNREYSNGAIPSTTEPNLALYPFWDDMDVRTSGTVHYYNDSTNRRFVVQWTNVPHFSTGGPYTFQIQIKSNGEILYQYLSVTAPLDQATIGIENGSGTVALQVIYNASYVHNSLAILISRGLSWVEESLTSGTIIPGGNQPVTVTFNSTDLTAGTYRGNLAIVSNDGPRSPRNIPIRLSVIITGVPEQPASGLPREFALDQNYPNPFNPTTTISYALPTQATVRLKIINMLGQEVTTLVNAPQPGGFYNVTWTGHSDRGFAVSSGVYAYRLEARTAEGRIINILKKMVLLK